MSEKAPRAQLLTALALLGVAYLIYNQHQLRNEVDSQTAVAAHSAAVGWQHQVLVERRVREGMALAEDIVCNETEKAAKARAYLTELPIDPKLQSQALVSKARVVLVMGSNCSLTVDRMALLEAETYLGRAMLADPQSDLALILLGRVHHETGRYHTAIQTLQKAEKLGSKDARLDLNFALAYMGLGDWKSAADRLQRVPRCEPGKEDFGACGGRRTAHARLRLYREAGDQEAVARELLRALEEFPTDAYLQVQYAEHLMRVTGDVDAAIEVAETAVAQSRSRMAERELAFALYAKAAYTHARNPKASERWLARAKQLEPDRLSLWPCIGPGIAVNAATRALATSWLAEGYSLEATDGNGNTLLICTSLRGSVDDLRWLVNHGADLNAKNKYGATALNFAAEKGREDIVEFLIAKKADVRTFNNVGGTALFHAAAGGYTAIVKRLLDANADIDHATNSGMTALMAAAYSGSKPTVQLLLDSGADASLRTTETSQDAAQLAQANGHPDVSDLINARTSDQVGM